MPGKSPSKEQVKPWPVGRGPLEFYEPNGNKCAYLYEWDVPGPRHVKDITKIISHGLGLETAAAFAGLPGAIIRHWLVRGRNEEVEPFNPNGEDVTEKDLRRHKTVTMPCYNFWLAWKKARAEFLMNCVVKVKKSKDWRAAAWLLERGDPANYVRPNASLAIKRELRDHEKEVEGQVVEAGEEVIQILLPDNSRSK